MTHGCYMWAPKSQCDADCIRGGRYCAADSVAPQFAGRYGGRQVGLFMFNLICLEGRRSEPRVLALL